MLFIETPTNPVMRLTDLAAASALAHGRGVKVVVDNTFASPCLQRPIEFGADLVVHSTTKYLNGHSDSVGGIVVGVHDDDLEWLKFIQNAEGAILSPFDSLLVLRGTKTLALRMAQHNINGQALAEYLAGHPEVKQVLYPGLPEHPQHELAKRQMRGFGGMLSFDVGHVRERAPRLQPCQADVARREPRRRRDAHLPSRVDDPRLGAARAPRRDRPDRQPRPDLGRRRRPAGPDRGHCTGARLSNAEC